MHIYEKVLILATKECILAEIQNDHFLLLILRQFHGYFSTVNIRKCHDIQFITSCCGDLEMLNWHFHAN